MSDLRPELRVSDAERERTVALLKEHAAAGRLDTDELASRVHDAYSAGTVGELSAVVRDLPEGPRPRSPRAVAHLRHQALAFLVVNVGLIGIWAASGAGSFWPIWPILGWGIGLALRATRVYGGSDDEHAPADRELTRGD